MWNDLTWNDLTWNDLMSNDLTWNDLMWNDLTWNDLTWNDLTWNDLTWNDLTWNDLTWNDQSNTKPFLHDNNEFGKKSCPLLSSNVLYCQSFVVISDNNIKQDFFQFKDKNLTLKGSNEKTFTLCVLSLVLPQCIKRKQFLNLTLFDLFGVRLISVHLCDPIRGCTRAF